MITDKALSSFYFPGTVLSSLGLLDHKTAMK